MTEFPKLPPPRPMAGAGKPVNWLFAFKFNGATFPGCGPDGKSPAEGTPGAFGGKVDAYPQGHSQQYVFATSASSKLQMGTGCIGFTLQDPLGATFGQVYLTPGYYYVVWNDQFYNNPIANHDSPWGHSKGMVAWNDDGEGMVLQVSTPSWPASGSSKFPRQNDGNTLGCINDDDIEVSQHFFALAINKDDLVQILKALANASVATDVSQPSIVQNGGPADVQALVKALGKLSSSTSVFQAKLSSGVTLLSKPSSLAVPPWQMVSALLGGMDLRVACWWAAPAIGSTTANTQIKCWSPSLGKYGAVQVATSGSWQGKTLGLQGGDGDQYNHAKIGISEDPKQQMCIFGDMNQQGALWENYAYQGQKCNSSQNGRGGLFYAFKNADLFASLAAMLKGDSAPLAPDGPPTDSPGNADPTGKAKKKTTPAAKKKSVTGKATKKSVKKAAVKKTAKKVSKKPSVKKAVRKSTAKKTAKKSTAKKPVKKAAKKTVGKSTLKKSVKKAAKKAAPKKAVKKTTKKSVAKRPAKSTSRKSVRRGTR